MTTVNSHSTQLARRPSDHRTLITSKTVGDVLAQVKPPRSRKLVDLPSTATMEDAFDVLLEHDILSVPVYQTTEDGGKKYLTIVSVLDLLKLLSGDAAERKVLLKPLSEAIGLTEESSKLVTVRPGDSLEYVMQLFSRHGAHRVLVQDGGDVLQEPVLLSQMDVARYLQAYNHELGPILDLTTPTIAEQACARRGSEQPLLASITYRITAMEAFVKLANSSVGALAVETDDDDHVLVGELSPEHLRGLNRDRFDALQRPVVMYLKGRCGDDELDPPLTCHDRFTLSQIMTAFVLRKAHRLWWCDDTGHAKGVITLTDLIGTFLDQAVVA